MSYKIISLDGGGIRGIITAVIIRRICKVIPNFLDDTDMIAGVSTGAIVATMLADGAAPQTVVASYKSIGTSIFKRPVFYKILSCNGYTLNKYRKRELERSLISFFGDRTISELKKDIIIPAFDLKKNTIAGPQWSPKFFDNFHGSHDSVEKIKDVVLSSASGPIYFEGHNGYIDGGVTCNNPSMAALAAAVNKTKRDNAPDLSDIKLISIGTGRFLKYIDGKERNWGTLKWLNPIISILFDGSINVPDYQCKQFLLDKYFRIDPIIKDDIELDGTDKIDELMDYALSVDITETLEWLHKNWN